MMGNRSLGGGSGEGCAVGGGNGFGREDEIGSSNRLRLRGTDRWLERLGM